MSQRLASWPKSETVGSAQPRTHKRPELRLVKNSPQRRLARLTPRGRIITLIAAVVVALFGVVVFHVNISQSQFAIEEMQQKAGDEQDRYERLRLEVSTLESPARVSQYAQERLGLVSPEHVKAVAPREQDVAKGLPIDGVNPQSSNTGDLGWTKLKPHLSASSS